MRDSQSVLNGHRISWDINECWKGRFATRSIDHLHVFTMHMKDVECLY